MKKKLWIISDLHLENLSYPSAFSPKRPDFDILVVAGDVWEGYVQASIGYLAHLAQGKPVVYVLGNHEHWYGTIHETIQTSREIAKEYGVYLLDDEEIALEGIRFVGGTLWTDYHLGPSRSDTETAGQEISFLKGNTVEKITIGDVRLLHKNTSKIIESSLTRQNDQPIVVVTHHAPHPNATFGFKKTWLAGSMASNLTKLIDMNSAQLWIHGHSHLSFDYNIPGKTRVVCNPVGNLFSNSHFIEDFVVEV